MDSRSKETNFQVATRLTAERMFLRSAAAEIVSNAASAAALPPGGSATIAAAFFLAATRPSGAMGGGRQRQFVATGRDPDPTFPGTQTSESLLGRVPLCNTARLLSAYLDLRDQVSGERAPYEAHRS